MQTKTYANGRALQGTETLTMTMTVTRAPRRRGVLCTESPAPLRRGQPAGGSDPDAEYEARVEALREKHVDR